MFKQYRKFAQKYANKDPLEAIEREYRKSQGLNDEQAEVAPSNDSQEAKED